jgi:hypothetical protein
LYKALYNSLLGAGAARGGGAETEAAILAGALGLAAPGSATAAGRSRAVELFCADAFFTFGFLGGIGLETAVSSEL